MLRKKVLKVPNKLHQTFTVCLEKDPVLALLFLAFLLGDLL